MTARDTRQAPALEDLRDTLEAVGECARPLTALDPEVLAEQTAAAFAHAWRHATGAAADTSDDRRARTRRHLAAALAAARSALLEGTGPGTLDDTTDVGGDERGAYRSAAAYAAAAGCVLAAADPAQRTRTEQLISRLTLTVAELDVADAATQPAPAPRD